MIASEKRDEVHSPSLFSLHTPRCNRDARMKTTKTIMIDRPEDNAGETSDPMIIRIWLCTPSRFNSPIINIDSGTSLNWLCIAIFSRPVQCSFAARQLKRQFTWLGPVVHTSRSYLPWLLAFVCLWRRRRSLMFSSSCKKVLINRLDLACATRMNVFSSLSSSMIIVGICQWAKGQRCSRGFDWSTHTHTFFPLIWQIWLGLIETNISPRLRRFLRRDEKDI